MSDVPDFSGCPVCGVPDAPQVAPGGRGAIRIQCLNCGDHRFAREAFEDLPARQLSTSQQACLGYAVRKIGAATSITNSLLDRLLAATTLPPALERIDNLMLALAEANPPGEGADLSGRSLRAMLGATSDMGVKWVVDQALELGYISGESPNSWTEYGPAFGRLTLTVGGWQRHGELMREGAGTRHAFMAMPFGVAEIDGLYRAHLRPAVARAGFDLRTNNESHQTAGSIDNRMRVEIRTSRFLVCDLTHGNRGAYWEAGFAEGLGRPVFYTCRADVLSDRDAPDYPHFDTAHQLIIGWDPANPSRGMNELTAAIRATLPAEARLEDR
jgi:hypothetical protein